MVISFSGTFIDKGCSFPEKLEDGSQHANLTLHINRFLAVIDRTQEAFSDFLMQNLR